MHSTRARNPSYYNSLDKKLIRSSFLFLLGQSLFKRMVSVIFYICLCCAVVSLHAQMPGESDDEKSTPLIIKMDEKGDAYIRFILWHQVWLTSDNLSNPSANANWSASLRRSRMIAYAQVSPQFLLFTHIGLNNLSPNNLSALGNDSDAAQLFLHGAWGEIKITDACFIGGGLHYWKGMTRSANQSTLSFMTLDQIRPFYAWHSLGITDQFARHLGIYAKGTIDRMEYRLALNSASRSPLNNGDDFSNSFQIDSRPSNLRYAGVNTPDDNQQQKGAGIVEGYIKYNFFDKESIKLPFYTGTYLGKKKVMALGGGFFYHPNGMYNDALAKHRDVFHYAFDAFIDIPVGSDGINFYASYWKFDYGPNYISRWAGTGSAWHVQLGYYFSGLKIMPYATAARADFEGANEPINSFDLGINYFIKGHHAKITAEYHRIENDYREQALSIHGLQDLSQIRLQLQVYI